jgi:hypothetical protein
MVCSTAIQYIHQQAWASLAESPFELFVPRETSTAACLYAAQGEICIISAL